MGVLYSAYEAKARFAEVLRHVREGRTVTVSYRGEPVAEVRPLPQGDETIEERLDELERRGALSRSSGPRKPFEAVCTQEGALARFLAERGE